MSHSNLQTIQWKDSCKSVLAFLHNTDQFHKVILKFPFNGMCLLALKHCCKEWWFTIKLSFPWRTFILTLFIWIAFQRRKFLSLLHFWKSVQKRLPCCFVKEETNKKNVWGLGKSRYLPKVQNLICEELSRIKFHHDF